MSKFYKVYHHGCLCWDGESSNSYTALTAGIEYNEELNNEAASLSQYRFQKQFQRARDAHSVRREYKVVSEIQKRQGESA